MLKMRTIQKNIRVTKEVSDWMQNHPLSDNSLVNYGLHLMMQMEANAVKPLNGYMQVAHVELPKYSCEPPF